MTDKHIRFARALQGENRGIQCIAIPLHILFCFNGLCFRVHGESSSRTLLHIEHRLSYSGKAVVIVACCSRGKSVSERYWGKERNTPAVYTPDTDTQHEPISASKHEGIPSIPAGFGQPVPVAPQ